MEVKKVSSKLIKSLTPTPLNLKNYKVSFWDCRQMSTNIALLLFYESKSQYSDLQESLAQTLVHFYPLAGRFLKKHNAVDCSDQGVELVEAEAPGIDLASVIGTDQHIHLFPDQYFRVDESATQPLLSIQASRFACGGMALAVSVSHRVFDLSSLETFVAAWSSNATNPGKTIITPSFDIPSLLPADSFSNPPETINENVVIKKLQFDKAAIASLKSKIGKPVSGARAVSAAIAKALIHVDGGRSRGFRVFQPVNMRGRTTTAVGKHACGNFSFLSLSRRVDASEADGIGIPELSDLIGEAVQRSIGDHAEVVSADRDGRDIIKQSLDKLVESLRDPDTNVIVFSDWTKFGFYEVDLGWGKPVWVSCGPLQSMNINSLLRSKEGDGIEAWLRLNLIDQDWELINRVIYDLTH